MAVVIDDPRLLEKISDLARRLNVDTPAAVEIAVNHALTRVKPRRPIDLDAVARLEARMAARPILDDRTPDELIGYDEFGLPS